MASRMVSLVRVTSLAVHPASRLVSYCASRLALTAPLAYARCASSSHLSLRLLSLDAPLSRCASLPIAVPPAVPIVAAPLLAVLLDHVALAVTVATTLAVTTLSPTLAGCDSRATLAVPIAAPLDLLTQQYSFTLTK